jgi:hypothetical protein
MRYIRLKKKERRHKGRWRKNGKEQKKKDTETHVSDNSEGK